MCVHLYTSYLSTHVITFAMQLWGFRLLIGFLLLLHFTSLLSVFGVVVYSVLENMCPCMQTPGIGQA